MRRRGIWPFVRRRGQRPVGKITTPKACKMHHCSPNRDVGKKSGRIE